MLLADNRVDEAWSIALTHRDQLGEAQLGELLALRGATRPADLRDGWAQYLHDLRDRHRIRPTFQRKLDAWQHGAGSRLKS